MRINDSITAIALNNSLTYQDGSRKYPGTVNQPASPTPNQTETRALITKPTYNRNQQRTLYTKGRFVDSYV